METFGDLKRRGVLDFGDGHRAKLNELGGTGPVFLRAGALSSTGFEWVGLDSFHSGAVTRIGTKLGYAGDVVITTKGNSIGRVGWVPVGAPVFVYSPHLSYWRSLDEQTIVPRYLYYWSRSEFFLAQLRNLAFSTDMAPYLSLRDQARLTIALPSVRVQRAVAEVLGALDDKIAANLNVADAALRLAEAKFRLARQRSTISERTFADVADVSGGGTPRTSVDEYWNGDVMWATPTDVTALAGPFLRATARSITEQGLAACSSALHPAGSILMTSRATIGAFAVAKVPMAVNQGFIVVNTKGDVPQSWLFHEMRSRVSEFISHANGATFLELSRGKFKQFPLHLADAEVMNRFAEDAEALHAAASASLDENEVLARTRDALLPLLMSGKVRVTGAEKVVEGAL